MGRPKSGAMNQRGSCRGIERDASSLAALGVDRTQMNKVGGKIDPEWAELRLTTAELAQLERWGERVLDAVTLDAVLADA